MNSPSPSGAFDRIDQIVAGLAQEAGFSQAGVAAVPPPGETAEYAELGHFAQWIEKGYAGEMEYLKRRDGENRLLRSSLRIPFPWVRSVIVCAVNYQADAVKSIDPAGAGSGWIARYAWTGYRKDQEQERPAPECPEFLERKVPGHEVAPGAQSVPATAAALKTQPMPPSDYHTVLLARLKKLDAALKQQLGPFESRCYVDTGPVVERVYAKYAGLGWTGKNTCTLNQQIGSWFFLGVILTGIELPASRRMEAPPDRCGSCTRCLDACPTGALIAPYRMDASLCISYLTIEKRGPIPEQLRAQIGRQVFGCDICQDVCPWNGRAPVSGDPELAVRPELVNPALEWLAELDGDSFRRFFRHSPLSRAKLSGLLRNVAIAMGNSGLARYLPKLREWAEGADPVLAEAAAWAIRQLDPPAKAQIPQARDGYPLGLC